MFGCPSGIRTPVDAVKVRSPTARRRGNKLDLRDGFEPPFAESESDVLPLDERRMEEAVGFESTAPFGATVFKTVPLNRALARFLVVGDGLKGRKIPSPTNWLISLLQQAS
jgi:hypothetical protein